MVVIVNFLQYNISYSSILFEDPVLLTRLLADNCFSEIWAWCVDAIVDELESFTLIEFSDGSLVWIIVVRASM